MSISDEAAEAAWDKLHENPIRPIGIDYAELTAALEAAAPHMRQAFYLEMNLKAVTEELAAPPIRRKETK